MALTETYKNKGDIQEFRITNPDGTQEVFRYKTILTMKNMNDRFFGGRPFSRILNFIETYRFVGYDDNGNEIELTDEEWDECRWGLFYGINNHYEEHINDEWIKNSVSLIEIPCGDKMVTINAHDFWEHLHPECLKLDLKKIHEFEDKNNCVMSSIKFTGSDGKEFLINPYGFELTEENDGSWTRACDGYDLFYEYDPEQQKLRELIKPITDQPGAMAYNPLNPSITQTVTEDHIVNLDKKENV